MSYERPDQLEGTIKKLPMPCGSLWIIIGYDGKDYPREIFVEGSKDGTCRAWIETGSRWATKLLQLGKWDDVIDGARHIRCPACMRKMGKLSEEDKEKLQAHPWSCGDAIAREIEKAIEKEKK